YWAARPDEKRTLQVRDPQGKPRQVQVVVGQATDEHKPLLSLFVTGRHAAKGLQWVGWCPFGFYEASGPDAERLISWHFNTRDPNQPVTAAGADQYRQKLYKQGLIDDLVALKDLSSYVDKLDAEQMPPVDLILTVDDILPDPKNK